MDAGSNQTFKCETESDTWNALFRDPCSSLVSAGRSSSSVCWLCGTRFSELWMFSQCWCFSSADGQGKAGVPRHHRGPAGAEPGDDSGCHLWVHSTTHRALHQEACVPTGEGQCAVLGRVGRSNRGVSEITFSLEKLGWQEAWCTHTHRCFLSFRGPNTFL